MRIKPSLGELGIFSLCTLIAFHWISPNFHENLIDFHWQVAEFTQVYKKGIFRTVSNESSSIYHWMMQVRYPQGPNGKWKQFVFGTGRCRMCVWKEMLKQMSPCCMWRHFRTTAWWLKHPPIPVPCSTCRTLLPLMLTTDQLLRRCSGSAGLHVHI